MQMKRWLPIVLCVIFSPLVWAQSAPEQFNLWATHMASVEFKDGAFVYHSCLPHPDSVSAVEMMVLQDIEPSVPRLMNQLALLRDWFEDNATLMEQTDRRVLTRAWKKLLATDAAVAVGSAALQGRDGDLVLFDDRGLLCGGVACPPNWCSCGCEKAIYGPPPKREWLGCDPPAHACNVYVGCAKIVGTPELAPSIR